MQLKSLCDDKEITVAAEGNRIRPCDGCGVRRARWFCAADDAYLCHHCDTSVHSANSVACRHERIKLPTISGNLLDSQSSWSRKRSRSDRKSVSKPKQQDPERQFNLSGQESRHLMDSDVDLRGMEVEDLNLELGSLVGIGENQICGLGLCEEAEMENMPSLEWLFDRVKVEVEDGNLKIEEPDEEPFDLNVNFSDLTEEEAKINLGVDDVYLSNYTEEKKLCLKLNYEDVLSAWCGRGSPWADQNCFHTFLDDSGSEAMGGLEYGVVPDLNVGNGGCEESIEDVPVTQYISSGGIREARVMRYREKRRNRLFSKRIRYQVRKLNAEQRPRMKGRFVKKEPELFSAHKNKR